MNTSKRALMSDSQTAAAVLGDRTELDAIDAINVQFESRYNGRLSTDATLTRGLVSFQANKSRSSDQTQNHSLLEATHQW